MPADEHADQEPPPQDHGLTPSQRASDAERDNALDRLRDAFADGRLTDDEFDQRGRAALNARTTGELERLLGDLPVASTNRQAPASGERPVRLTVGVLGDTWRRWRWRVAPRSAAVALLGGCRLDLRGAKLSAPVTTITAVGVVGAFDVVVPPGVRVELNVYGLLCDAEDLVPEQDLPFDAPLVRVRLMGVLSGVATKPRFRFESPPGDSSR
jgi:Domain of unknown function (DUF1707)